MSAALAPGFADPVFDAQGVFRALIEALSRPGRIVPLQAALSPPSPLTPELAAVALALADSDAPLWLDQPLAGSPEVARFLRFHTGAGIVTDPGRASFALVADPLGAPDRSAFAQGTDTYPDRSTTVILAVEALEGGSPLVLSGPGIRDTITVSPRGLPASFAAQLTANRELFPRGIDWLLVANGAALGLPRSVRLEREAR
jgi:alpha-D-ribose 1-methylphosphonate 5-triphosphate synthase subunit PhnH